MRASASVEDVRLMRRKRRVKALADEALGALSPTFA
jgi:hypothetical protein